MSFILKMPLGGAKGRASLGPQAPTSALSITLGTSMPPPHEEHPTRQVKVAASPASSVGAPPSPPEALVPTSPGLKVNLPR